MENQENKKSIMCPCCKKFLTKSKADDGRIHKLACKWCQKWIWFKPNDDNYREVKNIPLRMQSSGKRFY